MRILTMMAGRGRGSRGIVHWLLFGVALPASVHAQAIDLGGQVFLDYFYNLSSPLESEEGIHGFTYRRLNLTTDFDLSDDFQGRARLEANDGSLGSKGPIVFVKDLSLTWNYAGDHEATVGVTPPPAFEHAELVWGYRSLEKTILDFLGIVDSRDFGIRFDGPVVTTGSVRYALMLANNSATSPETDAYKRLYGLISIHPMPSVHFTLGADRAGFGDARESMTRFSAFGGYVSDLFRLGLEGFYVTLDMMDDRQFDHTGVSLFGGVRLHPEWEAVARVDRSREELPSGRQVGTFLLGGISFEPNEFVRIIPNVWFFKNDGADEAEVTGRFTVAVNF